MATYHTVGRVGELDEGESATVVVDRKPIALFLWQGRYYALDAQCPHAGAPLAGGFVEDGVVTCRWHGWRFRLADGTWTDNPRLKTGCYPVRVVGDDIQIELPDK